MTHSVSHSVVIHHPFPPPTAPSRPGITSAPLVRILDLSQIPIHIRHALRPDAEHGHGTAERKHAEHQRAEHQRAGRLDEHGHAEHQRAGRRGVVECSGTMEEGTWVLHTTADKEVVVEATVEAHAR